MRIVLPLPPKELRPNARPCWQAFARAKRDYREMAGFCALAALHGRPRPRWKNATVQAIYYHGTARRLDPDNALAALKAAIDSLQDVGIVTNDRNLTHRPVQQHTDKWYPRVEIEIEGEGEP